MAYKRKARILFLDEDNGCRSQLAEGLANALGGRWLEARSAGLRPRPMDPAVAAAMHEAGTEVRRPEPLTDDLIAWADLVVTLDDEACRQFPPLPAGKQRRHYPFAALDPGSCRQLRDRIRARIEGMIGGMKMLERDAQAGRLQKNQRGAHNGPFSPKGEAMSTEQGKTKSGRGWNGVTENAGEGEHVDLTQFLSHQYLCESLTVAEVNTLLNYLALRQFGKGEILADIGEVGEALYFVVRGEVALTFAEGDREHEIMRSGPGEMLGIMSFFDRKPRSVRLVARAADTQVLRLSRAMYKRMKVEHPYIAINLVEHAIISLDRLFRRVSSDFAQFAHYFYGAGK